MRARTGWLPVLGRAVRSFSIFAVAIAVLLSPPDAMAAAGGKPVLTAAASRKAHAAAGTFDLPLSLTLTDPTSEPRIDAASVIVFTFDKPVTAATAVVTEGTATAGTPTFNGNQIVVPLSGIVDGQYVTVAITEVVAADGGTGGTGSVRIGFLAGDVNQNRVVTLADLLQVNSWLAQPVAAPSFRNDVDASGALTLADKLMVNARLTQSLPAPPAPANQPPHVSAGSGQRVPFPRGASLAGHVSDDGLPTPPHDISLAWSKVSGPGSVEFSDASGLETFAIFDALGAYVLRLRAHDGALGNFADVMIALVSQNANKMLLTMTGIAAPIEIRSFSGGASQSQSTGGGGGGAGKVSYLDASFEAMESAATPLQLLWLGISKHVPTAKLQVLSSVTAAPASDWTFTDVVLSSVTVGASDLDEGAPSTRFTLNFAKVAYQVYAADGTVAGRSCWDLQRNLKC